MEMLIGLLIAALGGLFYFKNRADKAEINSKLAETKGKDSELKKEELRLKDAIAEIDNNIAKAKEDRDKILAARKNKTLQEIRDSIKKGLKS